jgi:molybdopterin-containing oxidoreductase family iron-sulfur binding subunit
MAAAGVALTGCRRWPEKEVRPHSSQPEGTSPGVALYYATMYELGGVATGVLARSYEGRPIKIEGNPAHPFSLGAADLWAQASLLNLYDPDRGRQPMERQAFAANQEPIRPSWAEFATFAKGQFAAARATQGEGLAILTTLTASPTALRLRDELRSTMPKATWYVYEPLNCDNQLAGTKLAFGQSLRPQYRLDKARVIACFGADPLGAHPAHQRLAREWAAGRASGDHGQMNRLYVAEGTFTLTGAVADERLAVRPSGMAALLCALATELGMKLPSAPAASLPERSRQWVEQLAKDLTANRGEAIVIAGECLGPEAHALVHCINDHLQAIGKTLAFTQEPMADHVACVESLAQLGMAMRAGKVTTLLILDGNPVYDAPADIGFDPSGVMSIHLGPYENETSLRCRWYVPQAHYLECWGDGRAWDGTYSVQQPLIQPLFDGKSPIEMLAMVLGQSETGLELVQKTARQIIGSSSQSAWDRLLLDGVLVGSAWPAVVPGLPRLPSQMKTAADAAKLELMLVGDIKVHDGRFADNGWLQETPDPLTKLSWGNAALLAKVDADALGVSTGDIIQVDGGRNGHLEIPAYIMPGQAAGLVTISLGYGRTAGGHIGNGVGVNAYRLGRVATPLHLDAVTITRTGEVTKLAMTQDHHLIDAVGMWGREERVGKKGKSGHLVREATLTQFSRDPKAFAHGEHDRSQLFDPPATFREPHAWGMAIDLNRCIGCNACVVACQVENNIPIVGKEQVIANREMQWLRVDRYFRGDVSDPDVVFAPMACTHCENAPCEQVCPVGATVHDAEGLNTMVYNRCVGTRYCSNNCPYKVRRFNYFDFHSKDPRGRAKPYVGIPDQQQLEKVDPIKRMAMNPDVTVRMRGVMEKCTYCTQRLQSAKIRAKTEHAQGRRPDGVVHDGEAVTACQGACPTQAIIFGDLNDPSSLVAQAHQNGRCYTMLEELNLRTRTRYLGKLRNPVNEAVTDETKELD